MARPVGRGHCIIWAFFVFWVRVGFTMVVEFGVVFEVRVGFVNDVYLRIGL